MQVPLTKAIVVASVAWPLLLGAAVVAQVHDRSAAWTTVVYAACARVCHQLPGRSFHTAGVQWPVCARCSGLYLAAGVGALAAFLRRRPTPWSAISIVALAAVPTAVTLGLEWTALAPMTNLLRFAAALPLGAAIAFAMVDAVKQ